MKELKGAIRPISIAEQTFSQDSRSFWKYEKVTSPTEMSKKNWFRSFCEIILYEIVGAE